MASFPKLKLTYFDIKARAEPTRLALHIGGVPFDDVRLSRDQWMALKPSTPFGQIPMLEVDGTVVAQSYAILGYAGRLAGLMPTEPLKAAQVESVLYHLMDLDVLLAPSGKEQDAAKKKQLRQDLAAGPLTSWLGHLERMLANSSGYIACGELTVADLACFCRMQSFKGAKYDDIPADIVSKYPNVTAHYDRIMAHPKVAEWYTTHAL